MEVKIVAGSLFAHRKISYFLLGDSREVTRRISSKFSDNEKDTQARGGQGWQLIANRIASFSRSLATDVSVDSRIVAYSNKHGEYRVVTNVTSVANVT